MNIGIGRRMVNSGLRNVANNVPHPSDYEIILNEVKALRQDLSDFKEEIRLANAGADRQCDEVLTCDRLLTIYSPDPKRSPFSPYSPQHETYTSGTSVEPKDPDDDK